MALTPKKKRALVGWLLFVVTIVGCPLVMMVNPGGPPDFSDLRSLYRWHDGHWTAVPALPGGTHQVQVSGDGEVWAAAPSLGGIDRWDGSRWVQYKGSDLGSRDNSLPGGFAVWGREVWAAGRDGVARYDGRRWQMYPEAVKTKGALATAAGPSGVWVIDEAANLSHFDGASWKIENLKDTPAGAQWQDRTDEDVPEMRETADGALWLLLYGLCRKDADGWHEIRVENVDWSTAHMIGQDGDRVWLMGRSHIFEVKPGGGMGKIFDRADLPLQPRTRIYRLAVAEGKIWLATTKDLLAFDGTQWQRYGIPPGTTLVREVAIGPDGSAWVVGEKRSILRVAQWVAPPLTAAAVGLLTIGTLLVMWVKGKAEERLEADQAVVRAAGELPGVDMAVRQAEVKKHSRGLFWKVPLFLIGFPYLVMAINVGQQYLSRLWPGAPAWLPWACVLAPVAAGGAVCLWKWARKRRDSGLMFGSEIRVVTGAAVFIFLINRLPEGALPPIPGPLLLIGFVVLFTFLLQVRNILTVLLTRKLLLSGQYDRALQRLRRLSFGHPTATMLQAESAIHGLAGRHEQAEACIRQALANVAGGSREFRGRLLCCLGFTLTDMGRQEEAQRCFESSIALGDKTGSARVGLADLLLHHGKEPERALAYIEEARRMCKNRAVDSERLAGKAWALALLGREREMEEAAAGAVRGTDPSLKAVVASVHWKLGKAMIAVKRLSEAIEHFRAGWQADPSGQNGSLSRTELEQHGAL